MDLFKGLLVIKNIAWYSILPQFTRVTDLARRPLKPIGYYNLLYLQLKPEAIQLEVIVSIASSFSWRMQNCFNKLALAKHISEQTLGKSYPHNKTVRVKITRTVRITSNNKKF